jgi:hypothetical protein
MRNPAHTVSGFLLAAGFLLANPAAAMDFGNMMNPSKWMGGNNDRDDDTVPTPDMVMVVDPVTATAGHRAMVPTPDMVMAARRAAMAAHRAATAAHRAATAAHPAATAAHPAATAAHRAATAAHRAAMAPRPHTPPPKPVPVPMPLKSSA